MKKSFYGVLFLIVTFGFCAVVAPTPAFAKTHHKRHHAPSYVLITGHRSSKYKDDVYDAQMHLIHLGYYNKKADGLMGPKTKKALKEFQLDQNLCDTGSLTAETRKALRLSDRAHLMPAVEVMSQSQYLTAPAGLGHVDPQFADTIVISGEGVTGGGMSSQNIPSRFGRLQITEDTSTAMKKYNVSVSGQPILQIDNQPSVIGITSTYQLPNEDAIIFTTFDASNPVCAYKHHLLILHQGGSQLHLIDDCTEAFKANIANTSLMITFPESDDGRAIGAIWRYDNGVLEKL